MSLTVRSVDLVHERVIYSLSTELVFDNDVPIPDLLHVLRESHATGTLSFDINSGGIARIRFHQSQKVVEK